MFNYCIFIHKYLLKYYLVECKINSELKTTNECQEDSKRSDIRHSSIEDFVSQCIHEKRSNSFIKCYQNNI